MKVIKRTDIVQFRQNKKSREQKNQVWVGDITYIKTKIGWVYLAAVIDLYNREVIGYALSKSIDADLDVRMIIPVWKVFLQH